MHGWHTPRRHLIFPTILCNLIAKQVSQASAGFRLAVLLKLEVPLNAGRKSAKACNSDFRGFWSMTIRPPAGGRRHCGGPGQGPGAKCVPLNFVYRLLCRERIARTQKSVPWGYLSYACLALRCRYMPGSGDHPKRAACTSTARVCLSGCVCNNRVCLAGLERKLSWQRDDYVP